MRAHPIVLVILAMVLAGCADESGLGTDGTPSDGSPTGVVITVSTTGLDLDTNGYGVLVDGAERGHVRSNDKALTVLDPGTRTIGLTDLEPNCTADPASRTVTVVDTEVVPLDFTVACTATSGVVGILIQASGAAVYERFEPVLDGRPWKSEPETYPGEVLTFMPGERHYLSNVHAGDHLVTLARSSLCSIDTGPQPVTVTAGGSGRDTVDLTFSVTCSVPRGDVGTLKISASTTGSVPSSTRYTVRYATAGYWDYGLGELALLSTVEPNGTLSIEAPASGFNGGGIYWYWFELDGVPSRCRVHSPSAPDFMGFILTAGGTLDLAFTVTCPP